MIFPSKYDLKNSGSQFSLHASTSDPTDTYAARWSLPPRFALSNAATLAFPLPFRRTSGSVPMAPTHDTTASGLPTTSSNAAPSADNRSAFFHSTFFAHSSSRHHPGAAPDLDTLATSAPFPTRSLHAREPTKPLPPKTVTERDETGDGNGQDRSRARAPETIDVDGDSIVSGVAMYDVRIVRMPTLRLRAEIYRRVEQKDIFL
mmetsp:Transcript_33255/g.70867  ORF Transcript_33255/g.70867 Transcript_33255/m.70867 type:complete len:204 (-) Transcript_33255:30-641(-)